MFLQGIFKQERSIKQIRIRKMPSTDHFDGVVAPLSHIPNIVNAHGKEDEGFDAPGVFHDTRR